MEIGAASSSSFEDRHLHLSSLSAADKLPRQADMETANLQLCIRNVARASVLCTPTPSAGLLHPQNGHPFLLPLSSHSSSSPAFVTYLPASDFPTGAEIKQAAHMPWLTCCLFPSLPSGLFAQPRGGRGVGKKSVGGVGGKKKRDKARHNEDEEGGDDAVSHICSLARLPDRSVMESSRTSDN